MKNKTTAARRTAIWVMRIVIAVSCVILALNTAGVLHFNQFQLVMLCNLLVLGRCAIGFED